jgi:hypothetical protein
VIRRIITFLRRLPSTVRLSGGIINPWLWRNVRACWLQTGPPPPPIEMTDEEWAEYEEAMRCL